jgi:hypothetical protein
MLLPSRIALAVFAAVALAGAAEAQEAPKLDVPRPSPNATVKQTVGLTDVTVTYSSPAVRGRKIWGNVVPYDEVWRAGANECTKVTFSTPATIGGKTVPAGTYALFLLPTKAGWTFILNKDTSLWGSEGYKAAADVLRVPATVTTIPPRERLAFGVLDFTDASGTLAMEWETVRVGVKFELATRAAVLDQVRALKTDDWRPYNRAARYLLDAKADSTYAMELADKSIKLKEAWENVWTKAELLAAAGKTKEALDEMAKTISDWKK